MLNDDELKRWLQKDLSRGDKTLIVIDSFDTPVAASAIKLKARGAGCNMDSWNISQILVRAKGTTIRLPDGFEVSEKGHARLSELGVTSLPPAVAKLSTDLRSHLGNIVDRTVYDFIDEAIRCYEHNLYRSAIVMSWLAAIGVLQAEVIKNHLAAFNAEAARVEPKWRPAKNTDDLGRMKEADFLDRLAAISIIGKNVKDELAKALKLRNGCGHPNSLKVSANITAGHIELLLLNVFDKFSA